MIRKLSSKRIFDGFRWLPEDSVLITDAGGMINDIVNPGDAGEGIEYFSGILCPGFTNAHVHLELSHMKNKIQPGNGLVSFLLDVVKTRAVEPDEIQTAMIAAEIEMWHNGIVAAGDICNTTDSIPVKQNSRIYWTNFIEVINLNDLKTAEVLQHYSRIRESFIEAGKKNPVFVRSVLVPHSPYSVSPVTFQALNYSSAGEIISMHSEESAAENELYKSGTGDFLRLYNHFGLTVSPIPVAGKTSLQALLPVFNQQQKIILVHNTFITDDDIAYIRQAGEEDKKRVWFCLCPNANLYIENQLAPVQKMMDAGFQILLGTDSYSSNYQLSIAAEIKTLSMAFPEIDLSVFLKWATSDGATAFGLNDKIGSFGAGMYPGVLSMDAEFNVSRIL